MKYLLLTLILISCNPLRHYQKVATDPFRNNAERSLLSRACIAEFPAILDTPKVISTGIDSSDYKAVSDAYNVLVDSLIAHAERDTVTVPGVIYRCRPADSLRIIKGFMTIYKPAPIIKTIVREINVRNTAVESQLQDQVTNCRFENNDLAVKAKNATDARNKTRTTNIWLYIVGGLLLGGNIYQLFAKPRIV